MGYKTISAVVQSGKIEEESSSIFNISLLFTSKKSLCFCGLIFLFSLTLFALISPDALVNGDAALYQHQIAQFDFSQRTAHLGYYLLGIPFIHLLPLPSDYALNLMNCFYGALSILLLFTIALTVSKNLLVAVVSSVLLSTNYLFIYNAVYAEVYMPQLFFFLLSFQLVLSQKALSAGIAFGLAFLITPSSLFGIPCLIVLFKDRKQLLHFSTAASLVIAVALTPHLDDYFAGGRGLLKAMQGHMSLTQVLHKEGNEFIQSLFLYVPLIIAGIVQLITDKTVRTLGIAILSLWLVTFLFGERFGDVPVQLPTYALFCLIGGLGFNYLSRLLKGKGPALICTTYISLLLCISITGFFAFHRIEKTNHNLMEYRSTVLALNRTAHPNYLVIGDWTQGILFEHYVFQRSYTDVWINTEWLSGDWGQRMQKDSREKLNDAFSSGREIWLLDTDHSLLTDLLQQGYVIERFTNCYRARLRTT